MADLKTYQEDTFLARWVAGKLDSSEKEAFENWLKANSEHQPFFEGIQRLWLATGQLSLAKGLSPERRWQNIRQKTDLEARSQIVPFYRRLSWQMASIAAVVLLLITYNWWQGSSNMTWQAAPGQILTETLPCGSKVTLNAGSAISFQPGSWDSSRNIELSGEAFFEVSKGAPFTVAAANSRTEVLGTSFNVKAWNAQKEISCYTGKVSVSNANLDNNSVLLTSGLRTIINANSPPSQPATFNLAWANAWITGDIYFGSTPLATVFAEMERQYAIRIALEANTGDRTFSGKIERTNLETGMEIVCLSAGLSWKKNAQGVYIIR